MHISVGFVLEFSHFILSSFILVTRDVDLTIEKPGLPVQKVPFEEIS